MILSAFGSMIVLLATHDVINQDACLGQFEQHYGKSGGFKICNQGGLLLKTLCKLTAMCHTIVSYNVPETFLLYFCFRAITEQTENKKTETMN